MFMQSILANSLFFQLNLGYVGHTLSDKNDLCDRRHKS